MKIVFHDDFYKVYAQEPAAAAGRIEAVIKSLGNRFEFVQALAAEQKDLEAVHTTAHIDSIRRQGLYDIAALAAGGSIQAAEIGLNEPAFGLVRPPGHHASRDSCWGFCYFNNMAVALKRLLLTGQIKTAAVLDFDLHYGDGNVNALSGCSGVFICNPENTERAAFLREVESFLNMNKYDIIGVSAGFDYHEEDWGGLLKTEDYFSMGQMVKNAANKTGAGYFGILEGGYNHSVLGRNVLAFIDGLDS